MYLFFAAISYLLPFFLPYVWPLEWLFPVFLFFGIQKSSTFSLSIWCSIITAIHLLPIYAALITMASGPLWMKLIGPWFFSAYVSGSFFIWLFITKLCLKKTANINARLILWTISLWLFLLSLELIFLCPFGKIEGVPFFSPLLPMAYEPRALAPLSYVPYSLVLLWYCIITSLISFDFTQAHAKKVGIITFALASAPWIFLSLNQPEPAPPTWLSKVGHLPLSLPGSFSLNTGQAAICHELNQLYKKHPQLKLVIMPESSWNGSALSNAPTLDWLKNHPIENLIIGSFAQEKNRYYNCLYWYHNGLFLQRCDKRHAIPFAERATLNEDLCDQLYFKKSPPICPSEKPRIQLTIPDIDSFTPYICSDFYCAHWPDDSTTAPLLLTANDSWFMPHFQILMALTAQLGAIQWRRPLLYIAYYHAGYMDAYGNKTPIATTSSFKSGTFFDKVQKKDNL